MHVMRPKISKVDLRRQTYREIQRGQVMHCMLILVHME